MFRSHSAKLFFTESFTFQIINPDAVIVIF
jgi:hypothetical protein